MTPLLQSAFIQFGSHSNNHSLLMFAISHILFHILMFAISHILFHILMFAISLHLFTASSKLKQLNRFCEVYTKKHFSLELKIQCKHRNIFFHLQCVTQNISQRHYALWIEGEGEGEEEATPSSHSYTPI